MRVLSSSEISLGLSCICQLRVLCALRRCQSGLHCLKPRADRRIEDVVADRDTNATDQVRINLHFRLELELEALRQRSDEFVDLSVAKRKGCLDHAVSDALSRVLECPQLARYFGHGGQSSVVDEGPQEVRALGGQLGLQHPA